MGTCLRELREMVIKPSNGMGFWFWGLMINCYGYLRKGKSFLTDIFIINLYKGIANLVLWEI